MSSRSRGQSGASAVEFALVLPVLVMLLLGLVTFGVTFSHGIGLANAVREGSRFGASTAAAGGASLDWTTWKTDVVSRTRAVQMDDPGAESTVCVQLVKNTSTAPAVPTQVLATECSGGLTTPVPATTTPTPPKVPGNTCFVMVWGARNFHVDALFFQYDGTLQRQSLARYERSC